MGGPCVVLVNNSMGMLMLRLRLHREFSSPSVCSLFTATPLLYGLSTTLLLVPSPLREHSWDGVIVEALSETTPPSQHIRRSGRHPISQHRPLCSELIFFVVVVCCGHAAHSAVFIHIPPAARSCVREAATPSSVSGLHLLAWPLLHLSLAAVRRQWDILPAPLLHIISAARHFLLHPLGFLVKGNRRNSHGMCSVLHSSPAAKPRMRASTPYFYAPPVFL